MKGLPAVFLAGIVLIAGGPVACQSSLRDSGPRSGATSIRIEAAQQEILAGEAVGLVARTGDTVARDAKVVWTCPEGEIQTNDEGRVARVKFLKAGTYSVRATLEVEGRAVTSDVIEVRVKPVG